MKAGIGSFRTPSGEDRYFQAYRLAMDECPKPDAEFDIETGFGTTRVYRFGQADAPPMVLLSGMATTSAMWAPNLAGLSERHPVYIIDTLGEPGRSVQTAPIKDMRDRAKWLEEVLAGLGLAGVHLVGASTGGWHAFTAAMYAPGRLATVSLLDATAVIVGFSSAVVWHGLPAAIMNRDWLWRRFLRWTGGADVLDRPDVRATLRGIREYRARPTPQVCPGDDEIRSVRLPVLALFGGRSVVHNAALGAERARNLLPHAEVELWPGIGHHMSLVDGERDRVNARILDFAHRHPSR
jgi:pimeloyl-ACP methyl ester carboxylesterase